MQGSELPDEVLKRVLKWVFYNGWKWKMADYYNGVEAKSLDEGAKHFLMLREASLRFRMLITECYFRLWHWQVDNTQRWYEWTRMTQGHLELKDHYTPGEMRLFFKSRLWSVSSVRTHDDKSEGLLLEDVERKPSEILAHPMLLRQEMPDLNVPDDELTVQFWLDRQDAKEAQNEHHMKMRAAEGREWNTQLPVLHSMDPAHNDPETGKLLFQEPFEYYEMFYKFCTHGVHCDVIPNWLPDDLVERPYPPRWTKTAAASRAALEDYEAIDRCSGCSTEVQTLDAKFCTSCGAEHTRTTKGFEVGSDAPNSPSPCHLHCRQHLLTLPMIGHDKARGSNGASDIWQIERRHSGSARSGIRVGYFSYGKCKRSTLIAHSFASGEMLDTKLIQTYL